MISSGRERERGGEKMSKKSFRRIDDDEGAADRFNCNTWVYHFPRNMSCCLSGLDQSSGNKRNLWVRLPYNGCQ